MPAPSLARVELEAPPVSADRSTRLAAVASDSYAFIWRSLRRLGVRPPAVDDAAQQVFEVASRRLEAIEPGRERAFLFKTALLVAAEARRGSARHHALHPGEPVEALADPAPSPEDASDRSRKRALLDEVLLSMPLELRSVFVLFEIEEMTMASIAELLELPPGTVASRLRRAREAFQQAVKRARARMARVGGRR